MHGPYPRFPPTEKVVEALTKLVVLVWDHPKATAFLTAAVSLLFLWFLRRVRRQCGLRIYLFDVPPGSGLNRTALARSLVRQISSFTRPLESLSVGKTPDAVFHQTRHRVVEGRGGSSPFLPAVSVSETEIPEVALAQSPPTIALSYRGVSLDAARNFLADLGKRIYKISCEVWADDSQLGLLAQADSLGPWETRASDCSKASIEAALASLAAEILRGVEPQFATRQARRLGRTAFTYAQAYQPDQVIYLYERALKLDPNYAEALHNLGIALLQKGRFDDAIASFQKALQLKPDDPETLNSLGAAFDEKGQLGDAITTIQEALKLRPDYPEALNNLGVALTAEHRLDDGTAALRRALEARPDYPEALYNLGNALAQKGELDEAIAAYQKGLQLKPDEPLMLNNLGLALRLRGELDNAINNFRKALALKGDFVEAQANLGNALAHKGQVDDAVIHLRKAVGLRPDDARIHYDLGLSLQRKGDHEAAEQEFAEAQRLDPNLEAPKQ